MGRDDVDVLRGLYREMRLIREIELRIEGLHSCGQLSGSFHSSVGQEASAVGVCCALTPEDVVTSTHRGHGHAIAKGVPIAGILAELFGRRTGVSGGRGGSMHLHHRSSGFLGETAIVAGGLAWVAGAAWARRRLGSSGIGVGFMGDGAAAAGAFHETLRLARLWSSPCLFVCENNGFAHSMPSDRAFGPPGTIAREVASKGIRSECVDGRDVLAVREVVVQLLDAVRGGEPGFLECVVYRVKPHSLADPDYRYRERSSGEDWLATNDPLIRARELLVELGDDAVDRVDAEVVSLVDDAILSAQAAPLTEERAAIGNLYATTELDARVRR